MKHSLAYPSLPLSQSPDHQVAQETTDLGIYIVSVSTIPFYVPIMVGFVSSHPPLLSPSAFVLPTCHPKPNLTNM